MWEDLGLTQLTFMMTSVQLQVAERSVLVRINRFLFFRNTLNGTNTAYMTVYSLVLKLSMMA